MGLRFRTRKVFPQISSVLSSLESSWKMVALFRTIAFRRSRPYIWCFGFVVVVSVEPQSARHRLDYNIQRVGLSHLGQNCMRLCAIAVLLDYNIHKCSFCALRAM